MKRKFVVLISAAAVFGLLVAGIASLMNLNGKYERFKSSMAGMSGVKFGESQDEVLYSLGVPRFVQKKVNDEKGGSGGGNLYNSKVGLPPGTKIDDYPIWIWVADGKTLTVEFGINEKLVTHIGCSTNDERVKFSSCVTVGGVMTGKDYISLSGRRYGSEQYIVESLGKPDKEGYDKVGDLNRKIFVYDALGLQLVMAGRQLLAIHKYEANPDFLWWLKYGPSR